MINSEKLCENRLLREFKLKYMCSNLNKKVRLMIIDEVHLKLKGNYTYINKIKYFVTDLIRNSIFIF